MKWQQVTSHDHFTWSPTTISVKPPVGWWWPCHHLVSSWQHKISPHHQRRNQSFWYYIYQPSHKEKGKLTIPRKRPTDLSLSLWPWLTKPSEGASRHPVWTPLAGGATESRTYISWDRASIHLATTWITKNTRPQQ